MLVRNASSSTSAAVRRELALDLDLHGIDATSIAEIVLVASELVGNAVRHGCASADAELDVSWTVGVREVLVCVEDSSSAPPVPRTARPDAASGRGLAIIAALTSDWGYDSTTCGKRVWAKVPVPPAC